MNTPTIAALTTALTLLPALAAVGQGEPEHYRGVPHLPLGAATLETTDCPGCLIVSNISDSGDDGVCAAPGEATEDLEITVDIGPSGALTPGMTFKLDEHPGAVPPFPRGGAAPPLSMTLSETDGGQAALAADFSFYNPPGVRLELRLDGPVVASVDLAPPYPATLLTGFLGTVGTDGYLRFSNGFDLESASGESPYLTIKLKRVIVTSYGGGGGAAGSTGPVTANEIRLIMTGLPPGTTRPLIGSVEMRAANTAQFSLHDERVVKFGNPHRAIGQAHLQTARDQLTLSNISASGDDGVEFDVEPASRLDITIPALPTGETVTLNFKKIGSEQGDPSNVITSEFTLEGVTGGGAMSMGVDFADLGSFSRRVDVLVGETVIGSITGQTGPVGETDDNPECIIWDIKDSCETAPGEFNLELHLAWPAPVPMTIAGIGATVADGLRVVPEVPPTAEGGDPDQPLVTGRVYHARVTAANIPSFDITGETVTPLPACASDTNDDGVVNVVDLLALLAAWGGSDPLFDIAPDGGDGVVDILDLLELLADWGPCAIDA
ncbi:MAG: hypothetical protein ACYTGG_12320 [Planctomycetota bacterium]|jgi:hypothetical protein